MEGDDSGMSDAIDLLKGVYGTRVVFGFRNRCKEKSKRSEGNDGICGAEEEREEGMADG